MERYHIPTHGGKKVATHSDPDFFKHLPEKSRLNRLKLLGCLIIGAVVTACAGLGSAYIYSTNGRIAPWH